MAANSELKTHHCTLEVRGYELDGFGHVNHSCYVNYLEHARWKMLEHAGITMKHLTEWKTWPVIAAIECKYLKPTYMADVLVVHSTIVDHGPSSMIIEQKILRGDALILTAKVKIVHVNERGRPTRWTPEMEALLK